MKTKQILDRHDTGLIAEACRAEAASRQLAVTVAITDDGGHLLYLERIDARPSTVETAVSKARTSALMRAPTAKLAAKIQQSPGLLALNAMPVGGGVPLLVRGDYVGAIGVSGATEEEDEQVALAGCAAVGAAREF